MSSKMMKDIGSQGIYHYNIPRTTFIPRGVDKVHPVLIIRQEVCFSSLYSVISAQYLDTVFLYYNVKYAPSSDYITDPDYR